MSQYVAFDESGSGNQVATNLGWSDFSDWVEDLDAETFPDLVHLVEHGFNDDLANTAAQLKEAIAFDEPDADTLDIAKTLLTEIEANKSAAIVLITDGLGSKGEDDDSE